MNNTLSGFKCQAFYHLFFIHSVSVNSFQKAVSGNLFGNECQVLYYLLFSSSLAKSQSKSRQ